MQRHRLNFLRFPELKDGKNITVRLGRRWFDKAEVGDKVLIYQTEDAVDEEPYAIGTVTSKSYKTFMDITTGELKNEHDLFSRTPEGLAWAMLEAYPDEFNLDSDVTVLEFTIDGLEGG